MKELIYRCQDEVEKRLISDEENWKEKKKKTHERKRKKKNK